MFFYFLIGFILSGAMAYRWRKDLGKLNKTDFTILIGNIFLWPLTLVVMFLASLWELGWTNTWKWPKF